MKYVYSFFLIIVTAFASNAQTVNWNTPIPVTTNTSFGYTRPHLAVCNGVPVAVWGNEETHKIYASRYVGGVFTAPVDVSPNFPAYEMGWMAHEIAAAGDTLFVVFGDTSMTHVFIVRSLDGGQTFSDTIRVDDGSNGFLPVEPAVDVMAGGNPVVSFIVSELDYSDPRTVVTRSMDGGMTFSSEVDATATTPGEACDCCKAMMVASGNRSILVFRNNLSNIREFYAAVSNDGGATFPSSVQIDFTNWNVNICPTSPAAGKLIGDTLVSVFMSGGSGSNKVYVSSVDLTNTSQAATVGLLDNPTVGVNQNYPRVAGQTNQLGTVWQESQPGVIDIHFASSFNGVSGFSPSVNITSTMAGNQTQPDIAYGNGSFGLVFQDEATQNVYFSAGSIVTSVTSLEGQSVSLFDVVNVSNDVCRLHFNTDASDAVLQLNAVNGQRVMVLNAENVARNQDMFINTVTLSNGVYFITATSSQGVSTQRFVVNK